MRVLCVGRHAFIANHLARFFGELGFDTREALGLDGAMRVVERAGDWCPDVAVCDYDMLASLPLDSWERDAVLSRVPVMAVSLTRRPNEVNHLDVNGIAGFLYLPVLSPDDVARLTIAARRRDRMATPSLPWSFPRPASTLEAR